MIKSTGVFASATQIAEAKLRGTELQNTPAMRVHGRWLHEDARDSFARWLDALAVACGLPDPGTIDGEPNHYGMTAMGEFTTYEPGEGS